MEYWQQVRIFPIFGDQSEARFFIGIEPDVTLRRAFEDHLRLYVNNYVRETIRLSDELDKKEAIIEDLLEKIGELRKTNV